MAKNKQPKIESVDHIVDPVGEMVELFDRKKIETNKHDRHLGIRYSEYENSIRLAFNTIANTLGEDCELHKLHDWGYSGDLTLIEEHEVNIKFYFYFGYCNAAHQLSSKKQKLVNGILKSEHIHVSTNIEQSYKSGGSVFKRVFIITMPKSNAVDIGADLTTNIAELYSELADIDTSIKNTTRLVAISKKADLNFIESLVSAEVEKAYIELLADIKRDGWSDPDINMEDAEEFSIDFNTKNSNIFYNNDGRLCIIFEVDHYTLLGGFDVYITGIDTMLVEKWAEYGYKNVIRSEDSPTPEYCCNYSVRFYLDKLGGM